MTELWQVTAPHFCAGMVTYGHEVVEAAPVLKWTVGRHRSELRNYFRYRGWSVVHVGPA